MNANPGTQQKKLNESLFSFYFDVTYVSLIIGFFIYFITILNFSIIIIKNAIIFYLLISRHYFFSSHDLTILLLFLLYIIIHNISK